MLTTLAESALLGAALRALAERAALRRGLRIGPRWYMDVGLSAAAGAIAWHCAGQLAGVTTIAVCVAAIVDWHCGYVFDPLVVAGLALVLAVALGAGVIFHTLCGSLGTMSILFLIRSLAGRNALGLGDVKLGSLIGGGLGPVGGVIAVAAGFILGAAAGLSLIVLRRARPSDRLRFGPFLAAGTLLSVAYLRGGVAP